MCDGIQRVPCDCCTCDPSVRFDASCRVCLLEKHHPNNYGEWFDIIANEYRGGALRDYLDYTVRRDRVALEDAANG